LKANPAQDNIIAAFFVFIITIEELVQYLANGFITDRQTNKAIPFQDIAIVGKAEIGIITYNSQYII